MPPGTTFLSVRLPRRLKSVCIQPAISLPPRQAAPPPTVTPTFGPPASVQVTLPTPDATPDLSVLDALKEVQLSLDDLHSKQRQSLEELQACAIELAFGAASWLTGVALEQQQFDLVRLVRQAVDRLGLVDCPIVQMHPLDLEEIQVRLKALPEWQHKVRWESNSSLARGSCRVESSQGGLLSTLDSRLKQIHRIWMEELEHAQVERRTLAAGDRILHRVPDRRETA